MYKYHPQITAGLISTLAGWQHDYMYTHRDTTKLDTELELTIPCVDHSMAAVKLGGKIKRSTCRICHTPNST